MYVETVFRTFIGDKEDGSAQNRPEISRAIRLCERTKFQSLLFHGLEWFENGKISGFKWLAIATF